MHAYVFTDQALAEHAGRFVWLEIDVEKKQNSAFLTKYKIDGLPTMMVIDPETDKVAFRWLGSANVEQIGKLIDDAQRAINPPPEHPLEAALAKADRLAAEQKQEEAAAAYDALLKQAPADWPQRPRAVESAAMALMLSDKAKACVALARAELPNLPDESSSYANTVAAGLSCALEEPMDKEAIELFEPLVKKAVKFDGLLADDRSSLYYTLVDARDTLGDEKGSKRLARKWWKYLKKEADAAPTPKARASFDSHRLAAAMVMGKPEMALEPLMASERDLPDDYNAPSRLAIVYRELERYDEAVTACERALKLLDGPRRVRVLSTLSGIYTKKGEPKKAQKILEDAIHFAEALPPGQYSERRVDSLKKKLKELDKE